MAFWLPMLAPLAIGAGVGAASILGGVVSAGGALVGGAASLAGGAAHLGASALGRGKKRAAGGGAVPFQGGAAGGGPAAGKATPRPAPAASSGAKPSGMIVTQVDPSSEDAVALILLDIRRILNAMSGDIASMKAQSIKKPFEGAVSSLASKDAANTKSFRRGILRALVPKTRAGKALGATALLALLPVIAGMMSQLAKDQTENLARLLPRWLQSAFDIGEFSPEGQQEQLELLNNTLKDLKAQKKDLPGAAKGATLTPEEQSIVDRARAREGLLDDPFSAEERVLWREAREKIAKGLGKMTAEEDKLNIAIDRQIGETLRNIRKIEGRLEDYKEESHDATTSKEEEPFSIAKARAAELDDPLQFFDPNKKLSLIEAQQAHRDKLIQDRFNAAKKVLGRRPGHLLPYQRKESIEGPRPPMKEFEPSGMLPAIIDDPEGEILDQTWAQKIAHAMRLAETRRISSRQKKAYETRPDAPESDVTIEPLEGPFPSWYPPVPPKQVFTTPRGTPGSVADLEVLPKFVEETRKALGDDTDLDNIAVQANITGKSLNNLLVDRIIDNLLKEQVTTKAGDIVYAPTIDSSTTVAGSGGGSGVSLQTRDVGRRVYENSAWNTRRQAL